MHKRLATALAAYAALGVIAPFAVHGKVLWVVLILLAYFAVRTFIADRIRQQSEQEWAERSQAEEDRPERDWQN